MLFLLEIRLRTQLLVPLFWMTMHKCLLFSLTLVLVLLGRLPGEGQVVHSQEVSLNKS